MGAQTPFPWQGTWKKTFLELKSFFSGKLWFCSNFAESSFSCSCWPCLWLLLPVLKRKCRPLFREEQLFLVWNVECRGEKINFSQPKKCFFPLAIWSKPKKTFKKLFSPRKVFFPSPFPPAFGRLVPAKHFGRLVPAKGKAWGLNGMKELYLQGKTGLCSTRG